MKLISVIIPTYGSPIYLKRAIESCLNQTYNNIEVIIIDDNNPDTAARTDTELLVAKFLNNKNVHYIKHDVNKNGATARNTGIKLAKGEYLAFLDSDDEWVTNKLEKQIEVVRCSEHEYNIVYCQANIKRNNKIRVAPQSEKRQGESVGDYLFVNKGFMQTSCLFMERNTALKTLFNERLKRHQDFDFILRAEQFVNFSFVNEPLVTIDWSQNDVFKRIEKGEGAELSESFAVIRKEQFSKKAFKNFLVQNVILKQFLCNDIVKAIKNIFKYRLLRLYDFKIYLYSIKESVFK